MGKRTGSGYNYQNSYKRRRRFNILEAGVRGFLCTCNAKEKECIREAYNILNDYGDKLFGEEQVTDLNSKEDLNEEKEVVKDNDEIEDELEKEVESLKSKGKNVRAQRFQVVESGAANCIFIKTTVPDPVALVNNIMKEVYESHKQISRYLIRLLPIEVTCKAYLDDIKRECEKLFEKHFTCEPTTYGIVYNKRYNDNLLRDEVIESVARLIQDRNILHKVDLRNAKKGVIIEVIKNICCISVVPEYYKLKKYNLFELSKREDHDEKRDKSEPSEDVIAKVSDSKVNITTSVTNELSKQEENDEKQDKNERSKDVIIKVNDSSDVAGVTTENIK